MSVWTTLLVLALVAFPLGLTAQEGPYRSARDVIGEPFPEFVSHLRSMASPADRDSAVGHLLAAARTYGGPLIQDSSVSFFYTGKARTVSVASDLNGWDPAAGMMERVPGTDLFFLTAVVDPAARFEYKIVVDSAWVLDPLNRSQAMEGFGPNSEVRMPSYRAPESVVYRNGIAHGAIDTISFQSSLLKCIHPVFVYRPPGYGRGRTYPAVFVLDGGEYLSLALMNNILDNSIADGRIPPVIGVFIDPRTDLRDSRTSRRMNEYAMSDDFLGFLISELRPFLTTRYAITADPANTAIMGASLGGLFATYASFRRPDVFGLCAVQSPAYQIRQDTILAIIASEDRKPVRFSLDTGTIQDAQRTARAMKAILAAKGYTVLYREFPESHNWLNWRARIADILTFFWGIQ